MSHDSANSSLDHNGRTWQQTVLLGAVLVISLLLNAVPLWWGLPSEGLKTWAFDEIPPEADGLTLLSRHRGRYPPLHYYLLLVLYAPVRWLATQGLVDLDPVEVRTVLQLLGRSLSSLMATATVYLVYRIGRLLLPSRTAVLAALLSALAPPFVFYAKTVNLEAPYLFWFALSIFFFVRILQRQRLRDYVLFGAATACAIGTKDQAYGLFLLTPLVLLPALHRARDLEGPSGRSWIGTLFDRRSVVGAVTALALFATIHGLPFKWNEFLQHIEVMMGRGSDPWRVYGYGAMSQLAMLVQAGKHLAFTLGWPVLLSSVVGLTVAIRRRDRFLLNLLVFPISYYLLFIVPIGYHFVRFFLPFAIIGSLFAATGLTRIFALPGRLSLWGRLLAVAVVAATLARPLSLDLEMLFDSRYRIEVQLQESVESPSEVAVLGLYRQTLPRGYPIHRLQLAALDGVDFLRDVDAALIVVNEEEPRNDRQRVFTERLVDGSLNYRFESRYRYPSWPYRLSRDGLFTNLRSVNPELTMLRKASAWGLSDQEIEAGLRDLARARDGATWASMADKIVSATASRSLRELKPHTVAFGLTPDGWTRGTQPAAIVIDNPSPREIVPTLRLRCGAPREQLPVVAMVDDGQTIQEVLFTESGQRLVELAPLATGDRQLFLVRADRDWNPIDHPRRRLGISIKRGPNR